MESHPLRSVLRCFRQAHDTGKMSVMRDPPTGSDLDWRPFAIRTSGSATQGVSGLILATAVIAISRESDPSDAGQAAISMLVTALVFWLAHVYARLLGTAVSQARGLTRAAVARATRETWSLVEVAIPLVLILGLGAIGVIPERASLVAARPSGVQQGHHLQLGSPGHRLVEGRPPGCHRGTRRCSRRRSSVGVRRAAGPHWCGRRPRRSPRRRSAGARSRAS